MAPPTHEGQPLVGAVLRRGVPAARTRLAGQVSIDLHRQAPRLAGLVGEKAVQFGKGPRAGVAVRSPLLLRGPLAAPALRVLADMGQVFQADHAGRMRVHDSPTDPVVHSLLQPSLPSGDHDEPPCRMTGAFLLQPLSQPRIVVGFGPYRLARKERRPVVQARHHRQVALPDIDPDDLVLALRRGVGNLHLQRDEQIELFAGLVVPQFGRADGGPALQEGHVLAVARVGHDDPTAQGEQADPLAFLQAVVAAVVVGQGGGDVVGSRVQPLVALPRQPGFAGCLVRARLRPQALVGRPHLAGHVAGHLRGQPVDRPYLIVALTLQGALVALLTMRKGVPRDEVQRVAVGQARLP